MFNFQNGRVCVAVCQVESGVRQFKTIAIKQNVYRNASARLRRREVREAHKERRTKEMDCFICLA